MYSQCKVFIYSFIWMSKSQYIVMTRNYWSPHSLSLTVHSFLFFFPSYIDHCRIYCIKITHNSIKKKMKVETVLATKSNVSSPICNSCLTLLFGPQLKWYVSYRWGVFSELVYVALSVEEAKVSLHVVVARQTIACAQFLCYPVLTHAYFNVHIYFISLEWVYIWNGICCCLLMKLRMSH